jgi:hypothetical protein
MLSIDPDDFVERVEPRNRVDSGLLDRLICDMQKSGWQGRPLLVAKRGDRYEAITGSHRAAAAMRAHVLIPVVILHDADLTATQWKAVNGEVEYDRLDSVFKEAGLHRAAELVRQEIQCGGTMSPVRPSERPPTKGRRFTVKRIPPTKK